MISQPKYKSLNIAYNIPEDVDNIHVLINRAMDIMRRHHVPPAEIDQMRFEALNCSGEFQDAVNVIRKYVNVREFRSG